MTTNYYWLPIPDFKPNILPGIVWNTYHHSLAISKGFVIFVVIVPRVKERKMQCYVMPCSSFSSTIECRCLDYFGDPLFWSKKVPFSHFSVYQLFTANLLFTTYNNIKISIVQSKKIQILSQWKCFFIIAL